MADLPSILGGMAQGFIDFGKGAVDLFGTGGAAIGDLVDTIKTGKVSTKNQDDFRKWLYNTNDVQDAAAKGLGTALNGVQTVTDYIPGIGAVTKNPLFNAGQGALGGLADEFKTYGKDYDLGRAGERAAVSAGAALASGGLGDALKKSASPLLSSGTVQGLARGATGGAITGGGYAAIDGGDVMQSALQGAGTGALIGGATGAMQDFMPRKATYDMALTDDERQARIANAQKQIDDIGPVSLFSKDPDDIAKRARISELQGNIRAYENGYDTAQDYADAMAAKRANKQQSTTATADTQQAQEYMMAHRPTQSGAYGYDITAGGEDAMMPADAYNNLSRYTGFTEPKYLDETVAQLNAARNNPDAEVTIYRATPGDAINDGDWITLSRAYADTHNNTQLGGKGNILEQRVPARDIQFAGDDLMEWGYFPQRKDLGGTLADADMAVNNVMESRVTPGQLGLFDDMPTQTPKTGTRQTSLFDQPQEGVAEPVNQYAPVDGKLTQAMKDRYWELTSDANQFKHVGADNDLYDKINPDTLPKGYKELQHLLDTQDTPDNEVEIVLRDKVGTDRIWEADTDKLLDYVWGGDNHEKKMYYKTLEDEIARAKKNAVALGLDNYNAEEELTKAKRQDLQLKAYQKAELEALDKVMQVSDTDDIMHALSNYRRRGIRTGEPGALDTVLSERLGIAPGNTIKITKNVGGDLSKSAAGRYARNARDIATSEINTPEGKVSTMAHERLHSFQNEARPESAGRYDPEVTEAYKQLQKDLGHYYKSNSEIKKRYGSNVDYWASSGEQESRMFQQYLENKGYTDNSAWRKLGGKADEWGNEINPAFDKFIDKLRDLSKRGVALPALAALFGGGAYMASQENDKEKEVK